MGAKGNNCLRPVNAALGFGVNWMHLGLPLSRSESGAAMEL